MVYIFCKSSKLSANYKAPWPNGKALLSGGKDWGFESLWCRFGFVFDVFALLFKCYWLYEMQGIELWWAKARLGIPALFSATMLEKHTALTRDLLLASPHTPRDSNFKSQWICRTFLLPYLTSVKLCRACCWCRQYYFLIIFILLPNLRTCVQYVMDKRKHIPLYTRDLDMRENRTTTLRTRDNTELVDPIREVDLSSIH